MTSSQIEDIQCPSCGSTITKIVDTRPVIDGRRRRRKCSRCGERFYSWEFAEHLVPDFELKELATLIKQLEAATKHCNTVLKNAKTILELSNDKSMHDRLR